MNELYKRYRPTTFDRVVGCPETTAALENMLSRGTLPHAVLFHGPSGCGKTTLARVAAERLGCGPLDFAEVNSSAFRGIDSIRDIQSKMRASPMAGKCRVWLIDECHQLSKDAQNAALKMLEDTPAHVYFFLCTTEPDKLITAVRGRCTEMPVFALREPELEALLARVVKKEKITLGPGVAEELVTCAGGSARVLLVLLEKVACLAPAAQAAACAAKAAELNEAIDLCRALIKKEPWKKVAGILSNLKGEPEAVRWAVLGYARAVLLKTGEHQAYMVISCFKDHFFDSKAAGLAFAAFEAIHGS